MTDTDTAAIMEQVRDIATDRTLPSGEHVITLDDDSAIQVVWDFDGDGWSATRYDGDEIITQDGGPTTDTLVAGVVAMVRQ